MIKLNVLELLEKQGKTKYWLYKQLDLRVSKPEKKQVVSLGSCAVAKKAK